jgi:hypothetical protein
MSISKMYTKHVSYKLALDSLAEEYVKAGVVNEHCAGPTLTLYSVAHTLAVTMGLVTAFVLKDLEKEVSKLNKAA